MKKMIAILLALILVLSFSACGGGGNNDPAPGPDDPDPVVDPGKNDPPAWDDTAKKLLTGTWTEVAFDQEDSLFFCSSKGNWATISFAVGEDGSLTGSFKEGMGKKTNVDVKDVPAELVHEGLYSDEYTEWQAVFKFKSGKEDYVISAGLMKDGTMLADLTVRINLNGEEIYGGSTGRYMAEGGAYTAEDFRNIQSVFNELAKKAQ